MRRTTRGISGRRRRRGPFRSVLVRNLLLLGVALVSLVVVLGLVFAGSPTTIANGVRIDGIDVGGLQAKDAQAMLERRSAALAGKPVVFLAGGHRFSISPSMLGVQSDWAAAIDSAQRQGGGFGPLRGFRRIDVDFFGADVTPPTSVLNGSLQYELELIAKKVDHPAREPAVQIHGRNVVVAPGTTGRILDRNGSARIIVEALSSLTRSAEPVQLPFRTATPRLRAAALAPAARKARLALSAPVHLALGEKRWLVQPARLATLLEAPSGGRTQLRIGGAAAQAWLRALGTRVAQRPRNARFAASGSTVRIVPAQPGLALDAVQSAEAVLEAATRRTNRVARLVVAQKQPKRTTAVARRMGINGVVGTYTTDYTGIPNRIHNVQLVAHLVDDTLIAPGATFSFNGTTGARTAARGFLEAPVIINGEVTTGLGGGVCQVSTTVFNAAFEAGLPITDRVNHALYISHYPQGRDATVDYPSVDLKFVNDTPHWLLLRTFVGSYSLTVTLYGTPTDRRVVSTTAPLVAHGKIPVKKTVDKTLKPGEKIVDYDGVPAQTTSVTRDVYKPDGSLLFHDVWYSSYRADPKLVRIGPPQHPAKGKQAKTTTAATTPAPTPPSG
ncbi:MAG TPA: VanW family protein [Gaiellaceae bacterium]|nr:VanW family protein [Gaiellaceae bacterium]